MNRKTAILSVIGLLVYVWFLTGNAASKFASNGGNAYLMSPHSQVDVDGPNEGILVSVAGKGNTVDTQPPQPAQESHTRWLAERVALAFWTTLLIMLVGGVGVVSYAYKRGMIR